MSLTIIALVVGTMTALLGVILAIISADIGYIAGITAAILIAVAAGAFIISAGSYNSNIEDTKNRNKIECAEHGNEVLSHNAMQYCVTPGSKIIRAI